MKVFYSNGYFKQLRRFWKPPLLVLRLCRVTAYSRAVRRADWLTSNWSVTFWILESCSLILALRAAGRLSLSGCSKSSV
jgi:hypothetical protein